jgi:hypothetical protein
LPRDDQIVVALVLDDFAHWKEATFGDLDGVLVVDAMSQVETDVSGWKDEGVSAAIAAQVDDALLAAFVIRNKVPGPVLGLIDGSPWARIAKPRSDDDFFPNLPEGAKAVGSLTFPAFNKTRTKAFILIHHSWSIHGADIAYVLSKQEGQWRISGRDQRVFL